MVAIVMYVVYATFFLTVAFGVKARFGAESPTFYMILLGCVVVGIIVITHKGINNWLKGLDGD